MVDGDRIVTSEVGKNDYLMHQLGRRAVNEILEHDTTKPMFLYLALTSPHTPLQVPSSYYSRCPNIVTPPAVGARIPDASLLICAMVAVIDDLVHNVTEALKQKDMYENTLILFASDNGGVTTVGSNNGPYRGGYLKHVIDVFANIPYLSCFYQGKREPILREESACQPSSVGLPFKL